MESIPFAIFIVMLELTVGAFLSLYLLDLRGDSSRGFVRFQGVLYVVFGALTLLAMNAFATPELARGRGLDERWLGAQGPLALAFVLLLLPWNVLLARDPDSSYRARKKRAAEPSLYDDAAGGAAAPEALGAPAASSGPLPAPGRAGGVVSPGFTLMLPWVGPVGGVRLARYAVGTLAALVGLAALFVDGMAYRALADSRLGGAFVVLAFVAGALALGGVMTAMLLGHWYLNTPTASGKPLEFVTILTLGALAFGLACALLVGPSTARPTAPSTAVGPGTTVHIGPGGVTISTPTVIPTAGPGEPRPTPAPGAAQEPRQAPLDTSAMVWLEYLMGFLAPLGLGAVALHLTRGRSFQSATGMLYLCVAFIFIGEILARGLLVFPIARF